MNTTNLSYANINLSMLPYVPAFYRRVIWISSQTSSITRGFDMPYILLHAVQRDVDAYPEPCIYCQVEPFILKCLFYFFVTNCIASWMPTRVIITRRGLCRRTVTCVRPLLYFLCLCDIEHTPFLFVQYFVNVQ